MGRCNCRRWGGVVVAQHPTLAPTHSALVDKLGGTWGPSPYPTSFNVWRDNLLDVWAALASTAEVDPRLAAFCIRLGRHVQDTGDDFLRTARGVADLGELSEDDIRIGQELQQLTGGFTSEVRIPGRVAQDMFDAYERLMDLHGREARARAAGQLPQHEENDAIDVSLTHHLADGLVLLSRDYRLLADIDRSGTHQAPWCLTVGEVLSGRIPSGPPVGTNARRAAAEHRPRARSELAAVDRRAEDQLRGVTP